MTREEILESIQGVFREELENPSLQLRFETTASDVIGWDSLTHVQLISAVESVFKIRFSSKEIFQWKNVGEMVGSVVNKIASMK